MKQPGYATSAESKVRNNLSICPSGIGYVPWERHDSVKGYYSDVEDLHIMP